MEKEKRQEKEAVELVEGSRKRIGYMWRALPTEEEDDGSGDDEGRQVSS